VVAHERREEGVSNRAEFGDGAAHGQGKDCVDARNLAKFCAAARVSLRKHAHEVLDCKQILHVRAVRGVRLCEDADRGGDLLCAPLLQRGLASVQRGRGGVVQRRSCPLSRYGDLYLGVIAAVGGRAELDPRQNPLQARPGALAVGSVEVHQRHRSWRTVKSVGRRQGAWDGGARPSAAPAKKTRGFCVPDAGRARAGHCRRPPVGCQTPAAGPYV